MPEQRAPARPSLGCLGRRGRRWRRRGGGAHDTHTTHPHRRHRPLPPPPPPPLSAGSSGPGPEGLCSGCGPRHGAGGRGRGRDASPPATRVAVPPTPSHEGAVRTWYVGPWVGRRQPGVCRVRAVGCLLGAMAGRRRGAPPRAPARHDPISTLLPRQHDARDLPQAPRTLTTSVIGADPMSDVLRWRDAQLGRTRRASATPAPPAPAPGAVAHLHWMGRMKAHLSMLRAAARDPGRGGGSGKTGAQSASSAPAALNCRPLELWSSIRA